MNRAGKFLRPAAIVAVLLLFIVAPRDAQNTASAADPACAGLTAAGLVPNAVVSTARMVAAEAEHVVPAPSADSLALLRREQREAREVGVLVGLEGDAVVRVH